MEILTLLLDRIPELALSAISLFIVISKNEREKKEKKLERAMLLIKKKEELVTDKIDQVNKGFEQVENDWGKDQDYYFHRSTKADARLKRTKEEIELLEK